MNISTIINNIYYFITDKSIIITIIIVILLYLFIFFVLGNSDNNQPSSSIFDTNNNQSSSSIFDTNSNNKYYTESSISGYIILFIFILFIFLLIWYFIPSSILNILNYKYITGIFDIFTYHPTIYVDVDNTPENNTNTNNTNLITDHISGDQVFNIPGNYYNYNDAKSLCKAYGSRLANYSEVENAYNNGGEWCNYGWSNDQMALFPTQEETYNNLQKISGHEHDCGRPGINGGYISNPNVRFGVNCYGKKPKMSEIEEQLMETSTPYPLTEDDIMMDQKTEMLKKKLPEILVSPFNYNNWYKI